MTPWSLVNGTFSRVQEVNTNTYCISVINTLFPFFSPLYNIYIYRINRIYTVFVTSAFIWVWQDYKRAVNLWQCLFFLQNIPHETSVQCVHVDTRVRRKRTTKAKTKTQRETKCDDCWPHNFLCQTLSAAVNSEEKGKGGEFQVILRNYSIFKT